MKAAVVTQAGQPPAYGDFRDPEPAPGRSLIRVRASAISHLARGRASGEHYSSDQTPPFVAGVDGAGRLEDGRRVYFLLPEAPFGAMAELTLVDDRHWFALPDGLSEEAAAAMGIPGMSSWAALSERAALRPGETVLVNGASGSSGRLAIQIAKHLGAGRVVATARQAQTFGELRRLGADATVTLVPDRATLDQSLRGEFERGIDVVLDYLWGVSAEALIGAAAAASPEGRRVRYIQIGSISGPTIPLAGASLRSNGLELLGSGVGSVPFPRLLRAIQGVLEAAPAAGFAIAVRPEPLSDASRVWATEASGPRIVLRP
jgi:NADPH:quinone reductase-like Zn-dependent oxidoreductase